ncbi:hypothetical protein D3C85_1516240 [compost metagenome]
MFDRLVGGRHHPDVATGQVKGQLRGADLLDDALRLTEYMAEGGAFVVGKKHQDLHLLTAIGDHPVVRHVGARALTEAAG